MSSINDEQKEDKNIELLIDKKIAETKVLIAEKRLNYFMAFGAALLTIFGIILPIFLTLESTNRVEQATERMDKKYTDLEEKQSLLAQSSANRIEQTIDRIDKKFIELDGKQSFLVHESTSRIDKAIERMDEKFTELSGKQMRKAKIACYVDGSPLQNRVLHFDASNIVKTVVIKNVGDGTAEYIRMRLYLDHKDDNYNIFSSDLRNMDFDEYNKSDKPAFNRMYSTGHDINLLPAQDSIPVHFNLSYTIREGRDIQVAAILMIFYGEPNPIEVPFILDIKGKKS